MGSRHGSQELVVLFDAAGSKSDLEMRYGQFTRLLGQKGTLDSHADQTVKAAYAQVGPGLTVQAAVFFLFKVNGEGYVDPAFNLPLQYMAEHAGEGPDLGRGPIRMACRSQCPVPWHAINMWEPAADAQTHPAMLVQKAVWRNRLGLKPLPMIRSRAASAQLDQAQPQPASVAQAGARAAPAAAGLDRAVNGSVSLPTLRSQVSQVQSKLQARVQAMEEKLAAAFGGRGAAPHEPVEVLTAGFRQEMERQQQAYLEQIKSCREEIQRLKAALRHEQERSRRLQQLLRGDV